MFGDIPFSTEEMKESKRGLEEELAQRRKEPVIWRKSGKK